MTSPGAAWKSTVVDRDDPAEADGETGRREHAAVVVHVASAATGDAR